MSDLSPFSTLGHGVEASISTMSHLRFRLLALYRFAFPLTFHHSQTQIFSSLLQSAFSGVETFRKMEIKNRVLHLVIRGSLPTFLWMTVLAIWVDYWIVCQDCHINDLMGIKTRRRTQWRPSQWYHNGDKSTVTLLTQSSSAGVTRASRMEGLISFIYYCEVECYQVRTSKRHPSRQGWQ